MKIIGLSGQSGAGKTTALQVLKKSGATVCDCDKVSREVMMKNTPCTKEIISYFGEEILLNDGEIDRKKLGETVFFDKVKLDKLTEITHRYIKAHIFDLIEKSKQRGDGVFIIDAPLLFESGLDKICDATLAITAPKDARIERIIKRDGISKELAEKRISAQLPESELVRLATEVIVNDKTLTDLENAVTEFAERKGIVR